MPAERFDIKAFQEALGELINADSTEKRAMAVVKHPILLRGETDAVFKILINTAKDRGDKIRAKDLEELWEVLKIMKVLRYAIAEEDGGESLFDADIEQAQAAKERYLRGGGIQALDEAVAAWERILQHSDFANADEQLRIGVLNNSAVIFMYRYQTRGDMNDLDRALSCWKQLADELSEDSESLPAILNNLGNGLRNRYARSGALPDLKAEIEAYRKAEKYTPKNSPNLPTILNNLGTGLTDRYFKTGALPDLEESIAVKRKAVDFAPPGSPDLPRCLNNLGNGLRYRYARSGALADLEEGISEYRKTISLTPQNSPDLPGYLNNLGNGLTDRYARSGVLRDLEEAIETYRKAAKRGLEIAVEHGLDSAINWLRWAVERKAWQEAEEAYQYVYEAGERLFKIQLLREAKESFLKETQGLAALGAYSIVKAGEGFGVRGEGKLQAAVVALERGQARLMSEALAADRADFRKLEHTEHAALVEDYQQSIIQHHDLIRKMGQSDPKDEKGRNQLYEELKQTRLKMDEIIQAIRQIEGYENFLSAPEFSEIESAAQDHPLVYIMATRAGGLAIIVGEKEIKPVWLPELTEKALNEALQGTDEDKPQKSELKSILKEFFEEKSEVMKQNKLTSSYLVSYMLWRYTSDPIIPKSVQERVEKNWFATLDNTARWLWDAAMGPIAAEMLKFHFSTPPASPISVTLIPVGRLGLLPLHAAWTSDSTKPTGRRYALDDLLITYSPNARSLAKAQDIANRVLSDKLLAVDEPKPQHERVSPLPNSEYEVKTVCSYFSEQNQQIFRHDQATGDAVLNALNESTVLHFSCHGSANFLEPLNSGLLMSNGERLTLKMMLDLRQNSIRLAVLSACETGIPDVGKLPDEVVSLSAGMLQAGIGGVMASLWSVYDSSTMMLMTYFYELWQKQGMEPPEALRQAQIWMRDTTNREKQEYFQMKKSKIEEDVMDYEEQRCYEHPFHWAGFGYMGV